MHPSSYFMSVMNASSVLTMYHPTSTSTNPNLRYEGSARLVETPGDGTTLSTGSYNRLAMNGKEVYKFATREVPTVIKEALEAADMTIEDVDWLLLHQVS